MDEAAVRIVAFLPWGPGADSLPESMVPGPVTSTQLTPAPDMRAVVKVRSLPGGVPQLLMPVTRGARVRRLGTQPVSLDVESTGEILDAVVSHDGGAVLLERVDGVVALRATDQEGTPSWRTTDVSKKATRLLTNDRGDVFVSGKGFLSQINASGDTGPVTLEWDGGEAVMRPDGRLGFVRYVADRLARDWVELDPGTGACTTVEGSAETWALLGRVIGVDAEGGVYGDGLGVLGRATNDGRLDWRIDLGGIAVSPKYGVTMLSRGAEQDDLLTDEGRRVSTEFTGTWLAGRDAEGGHVLYKSVRAGSGMMLYLDDQGRLVRSEASADDVWLATDFMQPRSVSSVTPDGEVLAPVTSREGVYVLGLRPRHGN
jgi:hypothetical protein